MQASAPKELSKQPARETMQRLASEVLSRQPARESMQPAAPKVFTKQPARETMQPSAPKALLGSMTAANPRKSRGSEISTSSIRFQETSKPARSYFVSPMAASTKESFNPSYPISNHIHSSSHPPASATSSKKRYKSLSTVKEQSSENKCTKLAPSQTGTRTPDSPVLQKSSDMGAFRRGTLSVSSVSDASSALPKNALECRTISHDSFTQSRITERYFSSNAVNQRSQLYNTIMEDATIIEVGRLEEAFEQVPQSSRQSPIILENHQAEESFRLDDFSFQIPSSRHFTQSPSPLSHSFRDLQPDESFRHEDVSVTVNQDVNIESESLTKQSVLRSTPFDDMKEQPALEPSALCPGDEAKLARATMIKRGTSLVFAEKRSPKRSIQLWASRFDIHLNAFASEPKLELTSQANNTDAEMSQAVLDYMKYVLASHANQNLITRPNLPIVDIRKVFQNPADLFSVGQNDDGQMGVFNDEYSGGIPCSNVMKAVKLPVCSPLVKLVSGGMHTVALTSSGEVLSWGAADFIGRIDSSKNWQPQLISFDSKIGDAVCGECFTAVIDNHGRIWAWGSFRNTEGKEQFSSTTSRQKTPINLEGSRGQVFVAIAAGESHLLALCSKGKVYGWGINSHGQLGWPSRPEGRQKLCSRVRFVLPPNFQVRRIFAAGFSTFVQGSHSDDHQTRIYACGGNGYGELGMGDFAIKWHLSEVESMRGQEIEDIKGGLQHTVLLRKDGSVWVAGRGQNGQLGLGSGVEHVQVFTRLDLPAKISSIACSTSGSQTYLINDDGELFSCGYNCYGQLALKMDEDAIYTPHQVPLKGRTAILVSAGCQFAVLSASGK
ncbi:regulator of chromosome condensation 1/beta-lactamase-inhibitor protein II [Chytriomyces cf. hyalinus JEL632]|nr:regulator of chromosome condensation 1/beta-lactamase-inhibitor protein II [Chytriomyces cf. hyalinus JEL632]